MDERRRRETDSLRQLRIETDRLLLELTGADRVLRHAHAAFRPHADMYISKSKEALIIRLELAGVDPAAVQLEAQQKVVRVRGERPDSNRADKVYQQMEIEYGYFERILNLPVEVDPERATAHYEDGFLEIVLPLPPQTGSRRIRVNVRGPEEEPDEAGGRS